MKVKLRIDDRDFMRVTTAALQKVKKVERSAMRKAVNEFKRDVLDTPPSCPMDSGNLYNAHETIIDSFGGDLYGGVVVRDVDYAGYVHEGIHGQASDTVIRYTRPGSGPKWLESKLRMYGAKYYAILQRGG